MKRKGMALLLAAIPFAALTAAGQSGGIEFSANVTPAGGVAEPVRKLPFYLLRKSFADTRKEAEQLEPQPDINKFVEGLPVSKELRAWMTRNHTVELTGGAFLDRISVDDLMKVPEFFEAWITLNAGNTAVGFPKPKYREQDRERNPEKYAKLRQEYLTALRKFYLANPQSKDGIDLELAKIDPSQQWEQGLAARQQRVHDLALQLAQTRYLAATTETDLNGRGSFSALPAGIYWLSNLEIEAAVGDVRLRWDVPVQVRSGRTARVALTNLNAAPRRGLVR